MLWFQAILSSLKLYEHGPCDNLISLNFTMMFKDYLVARSEAQRLAVQNESSLNNLALKNIVRTLL